MAGRNHASLIRLVLRAFAVALISFTLIGCGARPITATWFKNKNSYDIKGQAVEVNMLTQAELIGYAKTHSEHKDVQEAWENRLKHDFPDLFPKSSTEVAPLIAAPILLGFVVDAVKSELEREATLYEAQFGETIHETGFWSGVSGNIGVPRWLGFEIVRTTAGDKGNSKSAASRIVFAMIPANRFNRNQDLPSDERLFVIKPMWLEVNRSRAKVSQFGPGTLGLTVNVRMNATWIDKAQSVHQDTIADAKFDFSGVDLAAHTIYIDELKDKIAGWFGGVPVSVDPVSGALKGNGTFQLAISVTESDESQVREVIERAAKYLGDNKDKIVQTLGGK